MKTALCFNTENIVGSYDNMVPIEYCLADFSHEQMMYESGAHFINIKATCLV